VDTGSFVRSVLIVALIALPAGAAGQGLPPDDAGSSRVAGRVVDAETGTPLDGVLLQLRSLPEGAAGSAPALQRWTLSDTLGGYAFDRLPAGEYRLEGSRVGYRSYGVELDLRPGLERRLSVGLAVEPIRLAPVRLLVEQPQSFLRAEPRGARAGLADADRTAGGGTRVSLALDAGETTRESVLHAVVLGEPDLFRSLQRLPSVSTRSDYTAELWTRGAAWHETRVYFDGLPLFNALHGFGAFSGIGQGALGGAVFHPGVRPASLGEGSAGAVDLETLRGSGTGRPGLRADLSVVTAGLSIDQEHAEGRAAWMLSGRRTYLDWLTRLASEFSGDPERHLPYAFGELVGRIDLEPRDGHAVEISGLHGRDRLRAGPAPGGAWGNTAVRATHHARLAGAGLRHTLGTSRNSGTFPDVQDLPASALLPLRGSRTRSAIVYSALAGEVHAGGTRDGVPGWAVGYEAVRQSVEYRGPAALSIPRPLYGLAAGEGERVADPADAGWTADQHDRARLQLLALWASHLHARGRLRVQGGARLEAGDEVLGSGRLRASPRLVIRYRALPGALLSAGLSRTYQYAQAIAPAGLHLASLSAGYSWALAGPETPALRADLVTLGAQLGDGAPWSLSAHAFARQTSGVVAPDPRPGPLFGRHPQLGSTLAQGVELSLAAEAGIWSGSAAYTLSGSSTRSAGLRYPSATDRPHAVTLASTLRPDGRWTLGAVFTGASGVPFTRVYGADVGCWDPDGCDAQPIPWTGDPNAGRSERYASLDLLADRSVSARGGSWELFLQVRNVLDRQNGTLYADVPRPCGVASCERDAADRLEQGLPRLVVVGARVRV
jgi:hypothetical protein